MLYDVQQTDGFEAWLDGLSDERAAKAIAARIVRIASGLMGDVEALGDGLSELKIDVGQGYRVYFTIRGRKIILLLMGGDKSSQKRDIKKAKKLVAQLE